VAARDARRGREHRARETRCEGRGHDAARAIK
jgi:hypothetical protein